MKDTFNRNAFSLTSSIILISITIIFLQSYSQNVLAFEENFLVLQTGIIPTEDKDYAISKDFQTRVILDGKIIRLNGVTTTGESYYLYQKIIDDEIFVNGKILVNGVFIPIKYKEEMVESEILNTPETKLIFSARLPHHTYAGYPFTISVKVFDSTKNPEAKFEQAEGALENVSVIVDITNQNNNLVTSLSGKTDTSGLFRGTHLVRQNIDKQGEYTVKVTVGDTSNPIEQNFTTFFRGNIQDYFGDNNP